MKTGNYLLLLLPLLLVLACGIGSNNNQTNTNSTNINSANTNQTSVQQPGGKTSLEYMKEGNTLFYQKNYPASIAPYQKALDLEKENPQLSKDNWHITIDNLSIAYGISGDLQKSQETIDYGISKDPNYPLFY